MLGKFIKYTCDNCGFQYLKDEPFIFFFDEEKEKIREMPLTTLSKSLMKEEMLQGSIYEGYCNHCKHHIRVYAPKDEDIKQGKHIQEAMKVSPDEEIINNYLKYTDNNKFTKDQVKEIFTKYCNFDSSFYGLNFDVGRFDYENYQCPNCNKTIKLDIEEPFCPNCEENTLKSDNLELTQ